MLGGCEEGASLQLSAGIWAAIDLSEASESTQGFGSSLRISLGWGIQVDRRTSCAYKVYFLVCSPLLSTFSGSSDEPFSMCITRSIVSLHLPCMSQSPIWLDSEVQPEPLYHLSFAPCPAAARTIPKHGLEQVGCPGIAELGHGIGQHAGGGEGWWWEGCWQCSPPVPNCIWIKYILVLW